MDLERQSVVRRSILLAGYELTTTTVTISNNELPVDLISVKSNERFKAVAAKPSIKDTVNGIIPKPKGQCLHLKLPLGQFVPEHHISLVRFTHSRRIQLSQDPSEYGKWFSPPCRTSVSIKLRIYKAS